MNSKAIMTRPLWNATQLAEQLGISESSVRRHCCYDPEKLPPFIRIGNSVRWKPETVEQWLEDHTGTELENVK